MVENLGSMTAATPCPDEDAIVRFILIPEFGGRVLNQLEATPDTMLWHNETKDGRHVLLSDPQGMLGQAITMHDVTLDGLSKLEL